MVRIQILLRIWIICFWIVNPVIGQDQNVIDSLQSSLKGKLEDKTRINNLLQLSDLSVSSNYKKSINYALQALEMSVQYGYEKEELQAHLVLSDIYVNYSLNYYEGLTHLLGVAELSEANSSWDLHFETLRKIGYIHYSLSNYNKALEYNEKALKIAKDNQLYAEICDTYAYMANIMEDSKKESDAIVYYEKIIELLKQHEDIEIKPATRLSTVRYDVLLKKYQSASAKYKDAIQHFNSENMPRWESYTLSELAKTYRLDRNFDLALRYANEGLLLARKLDLKKETEDNLYQLFLIHENREDYDSALSYYKEYVSHKDSIFTLEKNERALLIQSDFEDHINQGKIEQLKHETQIANLKAENDEFLRNGLIVGLVVAVLLTGLLFFRARSRGKLNRQLELQKTELEKLSMVASKTDNYVMITGKDDQIEWINSGFTRILGYSLEEVLGKTPAQVLRGEETRENTAEKIDINREEGNLINEEILNYNKNGDLIWLSVNATPILDIKGKLLKYITIGNDVTSKKEMEHENHAKNKRIIASINYAQRIQQGILPTMAFVKRLLPDSFILNKPKDIVSGDFYWMDIIKGKTYVAAVDCTGHGVPGALMSILCSNLISQVISSQPNFSPAEILDTLNLKLKGIFKIEEGNKLMISDGMDMALCIIDHDQMKIDFAGANNSLYLVRAGEVTLIRGNRFGITARPEETIRGYTMHTIDVQRGDCLYMPTDGYQDQFGGPRDKKFSAQNIMKMLSGISNKTMEDQKVIIDKTFEDWKGSNEQIDDVCMVGFKMT